MTSSIGLSGEGMQQSPEQWAERGRVLSTAMSDLIRAHAPAGAQTGLDIGCQRGLLMDTLTDLVGLRWQGIDPGVAGEQKSDAGLRMINGFANRLDFPTDSFDVILFANVFEHVSPSDRDSSLAEMARVLRPGGVIVGQIPNPYFLVESHSRLPLMGWLPLAAQRRYWKLSKVPWDHDFFVVTLRHLTRSAERAGLSLVHRSNFNYPVDVYPTATQKYVRALQPVMRRFPWAWQFVLRSDAAPPGSG